MHESHNPLPKRGKRGAPLGNKRGFGNRGGGRKTAYSPRLAVIARKCCERGMTDIEVADVLGIGLATLYRWKLDYPAFSRVFKLGRKLADDFASRRLQLPCRKAGYDAPWPKDHAISTAHPTRYCGRS